MAFGCVFSKEENEEAEYFRLVHKAFVERQEKEEAERIKREEEIKSLAKSLIEKIKQTT